MLLGFLLFSGLVFAEEWNRFVGDNSSLNETEDNSSLSNVSNLNKSISGVNKNVSSFVGGKSSDSYNIERGVEKSFTVWFYLALFFILVFILVIVYFVWSFFKRPKNKWEERQIS